MAFTVIEPEVAGELGDHCDIDHSTTPLTVRHLHYEFMGWLGSHVVTTHPVFLISTVLLDELAAAGCTGLDTTDAEISVDEQSLEVFESVRALPTFRWLVSGGTEGVDDVAVARHGLVVSDRALAVIRPRLGVEEYLEPWDG